MLARDLITDDIPPIRVTEDGIKALKWMDEFKVTHLPVVDHTEFLGLVSESDILDLNQPDEPLGQQRLALINTPVLASQHIYDVVKLVGDHNLTVVPVLDEDHHYLGAITLHQLMRAISVISSVSDPGGIIVLEMSHNDYTLTEIARIVEGNDARIMSSYVTSTRDSTQLEVTLKINKKDLSGILQTFERYSYTVKASFQESLFQDDLKNRYDSLMNYLNM